MHLLKRSLLYTLVIHLYLFLLFMGISAIDKKIGDGIYFNVMFLQFVPFTFAIVFVLVLVHHRFFEKKR